MGYAKYVGRVGALAVTLGVGVAMASTPAVAYAEPSDTSSSSTSTGSSTGASTSSSDGSDGTDSAASGADQGTDLSDDDSGEGADGDGDDAEDAPEEPDDVDDVDDDVDDEDDLEEDAEDEEVTPPVVEDDAAIEESASTDTADRDGSGGDGARAAAPEATTDDLASSLAAAADESAEPDRGQSALRTASADIDTAAEDSVANLSAEAFTTAATTFSTTAAATTSVPVAPQPRPTLVSVVADLVTAVLGQLMNAAGTWSPLQPSLLVGALSLVRNEFERSLYQRTTPAAARYTVSQISGPPNALNSDPNPNVLVIGVDGTNLSRILADDYNQNFFTLMADGTTAASSIVGHTTISNPSWSAILTGAWGERTGVINNVFTAGTYTRWPTVFNQLETHNPGIATTSIANWDVISAIAGAGSIPVDTNIFVPQVANDPNWLATDDAVGAATVAAITGTATGTPSFLFSYFVGVDENGHMYGGASEEYKLAIQNVDDNLGDILAAIDAWEAANPTEGEWTVIVVTDHGHQPQKGFGHGFQTPDETATFVIASGPDFNDGWVNPDYEIVDTTPTVTSLFGVLPRPGLDGVSLTSLGGSDELPADLHAALEAMIATNQSPDFVTNVALSLRTIFATIPYYIWMLDNDGTIPVPFLGDVLYVVTNIPAQVVAFLTGVRGASLFPIQPPGPPSWPGQESAPFTILACSGTSGSATEMCDTRIVA